MSRCEGINVIHIDVQKKKGVLLKTGNGTEWKTERKYKDYIYQKDHLCEFVVFKSRYSKLN